MLLATFELVPDGEAGGDLLIRALAGRGIDAAWAVWTDPGVDWSAADAVVVRSTWDYHRRLPEFLEWVDRVDAGSRLVNDARVLRWNADKRYLLDLADDLPVVPTRSVAADDLLSGLRDGLAEHGTVVVKPRVGASGIGVVVAARTDDLRLATLTAGPWVVQPFVESVRTEGETSVYVFGGRAVSQLRKLPAAREVRVQEEYGGRAEAVPLDEDAAALAELAVAAAGARVGGRPAYARVDLLRLAGRLVVSELELIEPGLYLDLLPENAEAFAEHVRA
jgi:glutathione synthase/RimK-type ligase-like ATP-grasp enzyme